MEKIQLEDKCLDISPPKIEKNIKNIELYQDVFNLYTKNCTNLKPLTKVLYEERINLLNELLQNFTLNEIEKRLPKSQYNAFFDWR